MSKKVQFQKRGYEVQVHEHEHLLERLERPAINSTSPSLGGKLEAMVQEMVIEHGGEPSPKKDPTSMLTERKLNQLENKLENDSKIVRKLNNFRRKSVQLSMNLIQKFRKGSSSSRRSSISSGKRRNSSVTSEK